MIYYFYWNTTIQPNNMVLFHLFFLLSFFVGSSTIRFFHLHTTFSRDDSTKKIRILIDLFLLVAHNHSTKMCGSIPFILSFVHDHSTKKSTVPHLFIYFICTWAFNQNQGSLLVFNLLFSKLCQCFLRYIHSSAALIYSLYCIHVSTALIFRTLYSLSLYFVRYIHGYMKSWPLCEIFFLIFSTYSDVNRIEGVV